MEVESLSAKTSNLIEAGFFHPRLAYQEITVGIPQLRTPAGLLHISDLHFGDYGRHSWVPYKKQQILVKQIVDLAQAASDVMPTALVLTGDVGTYIRELGMVCITPAGQIEQMLEPFESLDIPKFACLGNHDTHSDEMGKILRQSGFKTLLPDQKDPVLGNFSGQLSMWALPDLNTQQDWHTRVCESISNFSLGLDPEIIPIILTHNPDSFDHLPKDLYYFGLAGHTHGGAYKQEFANSFALQKLGLKNHRYKSGIQHNGGESTFYISAGAGRHIVTPNSDIEMEITRFNLVPKHSHRKE